MVTEFEPRSMAEMQWSRDHSCISNTSTDPGQVPFGDGSLPMMAPGEIKMRWAPHLYKYKHHAELLRRHLVHGTRLAAFILWADQSAGPSQHRERSSVDVVIAPSAPFAHHRCQKWVKFFSNAAWIDGLCSLTSAAVYMIRVMVGAGMSRPTPAALSS
jgi:hypothetical protein